MLAQTHPQQTERLETLRRYAVLDTPRESEYDDIVALVAAVCEMPVALISFIDADRQWFKAELGLGCAQTPLDMSVCSHAILEPDFLEIEDMRADPRTADNVLITAEGGGFRFYAGAVLSAQDGLPLGTLCVLDTKPRTLTPLQRQTLRTMAGAVMRELELRRALAEQDVLRREVDHRVKNSLASIAAIIQLEAREQQSADARAALESVQARLAALSALHEEMHDSEGHKEVAVRPLIERTLAKMRLLVPDNVVFETEAPARSVPVDEAKALALIVNEFVANSVKHAYADGRAGTIRVTVSDGNGERVTLRCCDDGAGDATALARVTGKSGLGTRVIAALARSLCADARWGSDGRGLWLEVAPR